MVFQLLAQIYDFLFIVLLEVYPCEYLVVDLPHLDVVGTLVLVVLLHLKVYGLLEGPRDLLLHLVYDLLLDVSFQVHRSLEFVKRFVARVLHVLEHLAHLPEFFLDLEHTLLCGPVNLLDYLPGVDVAPLEIHRGRLHLVESEFLLYHSAPLFKL